MDYDLHAAVPSLEDQITSYLGENPPSSRSQLCEALEVSRTTLGRAIKKLIDAHAVISVKGGASVNSVHIGALVRILGWHRD